jgi:hypothetical protein
MAAVAEQGKVPMQRNLPGILAVLALALIATGCADPDVHTEHAVIEGPIDTLTINVGAGDVRIQGDDVSKVTVTARIEGPSNHLGHAFTGGRLTLVDDCHENHCNVDIDAVVPAGVPIEIHSGAGDLELGAMLGTIRVRTGSGDILGWDLAGADLDAQTGSGDVALEVGVPAERIHVKTGSGDVSLGVPTGSYRLSVETSSGDRHISDVADDSSAPGTIDVSTGSGDVAVRGY